MLKKKGKSAQGFSSSILMSLFLFAFNFLSVFVVNPQSSAIIFVV